MSLSSIPEFLRYFRRVGNQNGVSGNQSGNGKSGPFWIRFPGVCFSHQLQSANATWGG